MSSDRPRLVEFKHVPAGPLADLKSALRGLYLSAQPATLDDIRAAIERLDDVSARNPAVAMDSVPSRDSIHGVLQNATFPTSLQHVIAVAAGLLYRHRTEEELVNASVRGNPDVERIRRLWEAAALERPLGQLVKDITPQDLMVSRALGETRLPPYVERAHDRELRALVSAAEVGRSGVAILVGDSTSGKTRACYEALRGFGEGWRVWSGSSRATALPDLPRVGPRTIVWLDEAQERLLVPSDGAVFADELRELVADRDRGPIVVLGTMWQENWDAALRSTAVRRLVEGCHIVVPSRFDQQARQAALDTGDPYLVEAVRAARDGAVVQYLAGVPGLMDRVATASAASVALLDAAADARRFDHQEDLPGSLLLAAVPGYLDTTERRRLARTPDWAARALESLTWPGKGDVSPLYPASSSTYQLEDYLDQHLRRVRRTIPPPETFWQACMAHSPVQHLNRLGKRAYQRLLFDYSIGLHRRAAEAGYTDSLAEWAALLRVRDDLESLTALSEQRPEPEVFLELARLYARSHDGAAAKQAFARAQAAGHTGPADRVMRDMGRLDPEWARTRWREWEADGTVDPLKLVAELDELGFIEEAIDECRKHTEYESGAAWALLTLLAKQEDVDAARRLLDELPDPTSVQYHPFVRQIQDKDPTREPGGEDIRAKAARLHAEGDLDALRRHGVQNRDKVVFRHLTTLLLERGFHQEAVDWTETSKGANQAYTSHLVRNSRWQELCQLIAQGNYWASSAMLTHINSGHALDPTSTRIRSHGLASDGTIRA